MEEIADKLVIIKEAILKTVAAKYIYLFGSYAYGNPAESSDIDIYAVIPDEFNKNILNTMGKITGYLGDRKIYFVDLFLVKESKFRKFREERSFEEKICTEGILLYEN